jgi:hypothetical protein
MERWTFLILSAEDGSPEQIRMIMKSGDDPAGWPRAQVAVDGTEVEVDEVEKDYEAPEWKAIEIFETGGGDRTRWEELKHSLRAEVVS